MAMTVRSKMHIVRMGMDRLLIGDMGSVLTLLAMRVRVGIVPMRVPVAMSMTM